MRVFISPEGREGGAWLGNTCGTCVFIMTSFRICEKFTEWGKEGIAVEVKQNNKKNMAR